MATLLQVYASLFPHEPQRHAPFGRAPLLPADLFAFTGHLLERSGAYHHVSPAVPDLTDSGYRRVLVDDTLRRRAATIGTAWRTGKVTSPRRLPAPPSEVEELWRELGCHGNEDVYTVLDDRAAVPVWWPICLELMMIADEASLGIGFSGSNPFYALMADAYIREDVSTGGVFRRVQHAPFSLSAAAEDVLCIQPKSRTPSSGCTLRSLTHHLALLPPRGLVRARWVVSPFDTEPGPNTDRLGLLLIPFPYRVGDGAFRPAGSAADAHWGWFDTDQIWLPEKDDRSKRRGFVTFVLTLIEEARARGERVDGVVLPELALDYDQFLLVGRALARDGGIDFLIAGMSCDRTGRPGNFVAIAPFFLLGEERKGAITGWEPLVLIREKHHRWKLDGEQIKAYGLSALDEGKSWWENITILSRSLDVLVYRGNTTLTTLICEDLARVDPCQAVVRAIGPNLLIALLMDGPQFGARWPGRYATVLADDPGTSVLSFTSLGLMARQNDIGKFEQASSIALWKDEAQGVKKLELPREADALVLHLKSVVKTEHTLDGRSDGASSHRWEYDHHVGVTAKSCPTWIHSGTGRPQGSDDEETGRSVLKSSRARLRKRAISLSSSS
ncbi:hypothetical protein SAMN02982994_5917 [Azospirillum lipoferum]|nr:hypothetical protein SAMN02982994_5917 [Azospirillum lipoferum]